MATYQILSWHGIPIGVKAKDASEVKRENLSRRFQVAVDAVATATGNIDTKAYLAGWQWSKPQEKDGTAVAVAQSVAAEIESTYTAEKVKSMRHELETRLNTS